jgi:hypothetical protein
MRLVRALLTTTALTAVLLAGCSSRPTDPATTTAAPPAGQAAKPAAAAPGDPATTPTPTTPPAPTPPRKPDSSREAARAVATARAFLANQLGMSDMVAGPFRSTGARAGEVGFRHKYGEGRRLLPQTGPYAVVVRLQRLPAGWWVLGVDGRSIQIASPARLQRISSPLAVRGSAEVYEGTLYFKVTQDRPGRDLLLGQGFVDGSASTKPGDLGQLRFRQPASTGPGWVTFYDASADGSNGIVQATMVRVQFAAATPAPRILGVTTSPRLRTLEGGGWLELPQGAGTVVLSVNASNAQRVRFTLTPTGTEVADYTKVLGEDRTPADGFRLLWRYPNEPIMGHLGIQATGPGGTAEETLYIVHAEP